MLVSYCLSNKEHMHVTVEAALISIPNPVQNLIILTFITAWIKNFWCDQWRKQRWKTRISGWRNSGTLSARLVNILHALCVEPLLGRCTWLTVLALFFLVSVVASASPLRLRRTESNAQIYLSYVRMYACIHILHVHVHAYT